MALEISYWDGADDRTRQVYGGNTGRASVTLSGSSATCGAVPSATAVARCKAGEACIVSNNGSAASASNGVHLDAGEIIDIEITSPGPLYAKTA